MARRKHSESSSSESSSSSSDSDSSESSREQKRHVKKQSSNIVKKRATSNTSKSKPAAKPVSHRKSSESKPARTRPRSKSPKEVVKKSNSDSKQEKRRKTDAEPEKKKPEKKSETKSRRHSEGTDKTKTEEKATKNLFPIVDKDLVTVNVEEGVRHITETTLVSYPNLNTGSNNEDRGRRIREKKESYSSPEKFKSLSSTITVKHNPSSEVPRPPRRPKSPEKSLRDRVGWDPFKTDDRAFGDHDDRQFGRGFTDSYTRKGDGRPTRGTSYRGGRAGFRSVERREPRFSAERREPRSGMWSNNRNFSRNDSTDNNVDRSGINDSKWKRDMYEAF